MDSGTPRLTGTGTLRVIVEDVNDNQPTFENDVYFLSTEENVGVGTALDRVLAVDRDSGPNAKIRLVLLPSPSVREFDCFGLTAQHERTASACFLKISGYNPGGLCIGTRYKVLTKKVPPPKTPIPLCLNNHTQDLN